MSLAQDDLTTMLGMGGTDYAFKKLKRWRAEGPTERTRKMARYLVDREYLSTSWSHDLTDRGSVLIDLALEWNDFAMWEAVLNKTSSGRLTTQSGLDILARAWGVFTFDRTKHLLVHSVLVSVPYSILTFSVTPTWPVESRRLFATNLTQRPRSSLSARSGLTSPPRINKRWRRG